LSIQPKNFTFVIRHTTSQIYAAAVKLREEANLGEAQATATVVVGEREGLPWLNLHACEARNNPVRPHNEN
jgi:hypothetical protein